MDAGTCLQKLRYAGVLAFATVDGHGAPQVRSISAIHYERSAMYFFTAGGKDFCRQLPCGLPRRGGGKAGMICPGGTGNCPPHSLAGNVPRHTAAPRENPFFGAAVCRGSLYAPRGLSLWKRRQQSSCYVQGNRLYHPWPQSGPPDRFGKAAGRRSAGETALHPAPPVSPGGGPAFTVKGVIWYAPLTPVSREAMVPDGAGNHDGRITQFPRKSEGVLLGKRCDSQTFRRAAVHSGAAVLPARAPAVCKTLGRFENMGCIP